MPYYIREQTQLQPGLALPPLKDAAGDVRSEAGLLPFGIFLRLLNRFSLILHFIPPMPVQQVDRLIWDILDKRDGKIRLSPLQQA